MTLIEPRHITMNDVAELAGVAQSTVSHVINDRGDELHISKATQGRIRQSVRDLNYRLHVGARSIRRNRSGCLGVLAVSPGWRMSKQQLSGVNRAVEELDHHMLYFEFDADKAAGGEYMPKMIREKFVDGLIIPQSVRMPAHVTEAIKRCDLPAIWIQAQQSTDAVWLDESHYGREATQHLVDLGHRRICFASLITSGAFWTCDRRQGYEEVMAANGLAIDVVERNVDRPQRPAFFRELLARPDRPTALLVHWVSAAAPAIHAAWQLNLRVPQDLSIVSVAEEGTADLVVPPLTYWDNHEEQLGYEACKMLIKKIELGGRPQPSRVLKGDLVLGDTTAPAPGGRDRQT